MSHRSLAHLVRLHRWAGVAGLLLIAGWFLSGIVMIWVRMPALDPIDRLGPLPPIPVDAVRVAPSEALRFVGGSADRLRLGTAAGRPIWRIQYRGLHGNQFSFTKVHFVNDGFCIYGPRSNEKGLQTGYPGTIPFLFLRGCYVDFIKTGLSFGRQESINPDYCRDFSFLHLSNAHS